MLGFINNLAFPELIIIGIIAILIFGRRLPQVVGQGAAYIGRARRTLESLWRETGIEKEVRNVQREIERIERSVPRDLTPRALAKRATEKIWKDGEREPDAASPRVVEIGEPGAAESGSDVAGAAGAETDAIDASVPKVAQGSPPPGPGTLERLRADAKARQLREEREEPSAGS